MAFNNYAGLKEIKLTKGLISIGEWAFHECIELKEIILPEGLTSIGEWAFQGCTELKEITLPESLTSIGNSLFSGCTELTSIKLPKSLVSLAGDTLCDCTRLTDIIVDENNPVFRSVDGVFFDKAMTTLLQFPQGKKGKYYVPEVIISIRNGAFDNCKLTSISIPKSLFFFDSYEFNGEQLTDITVNELNPYYCSVDGVLFDKEKQNLVQYPINRDRTNYIIPDGIKIIEAEAFYGCKRLVNIVLPESLEIIREYSFGKCEGLKTITLPMSLQFIGEHAFEDCPNLETVTLSKKTRIGYKAFKGFKGSLCMRNIKERNKRALLTKFIFLIE